MEEAVKTFFNSKVSNSARIRVNFTDHPEDYCESDVNCTLFLLYGR